MAKATRVSLFILFIAVVCQAQDASRYASAQQECSSAISRSVNNFGASLTKALEKKGNLFISPLSIYNALAMVYVGAGGDTAEQMSNALQLSQNELDKPQLNEAFRDLMNVIKQSNDAYKLNLANGIFLQQEYEVNQNYINDIQTYYDAMLKMVDYSRNGTVAKNEINNFVATNTNDKIKEFLKEPLNPLTVLGLVNAIYFKGTWKIQFSQEKTRDGLFRKNDDSTTNVKFMNMVNEQFRFYDDRQMRYSFLELPYKGGDISMLLALPNDYRQVPNLDMTSDLLCRINGSLRNRKMETVSIPKFQLKYRKELVNVLQKLGIVDLFGSADLTGIREQGDISVSTVIHEAVIDVNEEGSEAAAATAIIFVGSYIGATHHINYVFHADHPFSFYIIDNRNGLILFSGRVSDP